MKIKATNLHFPLTYCDTIQPGQQNERKHGEACKIDLVLGKQCSLIDHFQFALHVWI